MALLTIGWGGSLLVGRCDLDAEGTAINKKLTRPWDLLKTGVSTETDVPQGAIAMIAAVLVYFIVQVNPHISAPASHSCMTGFATSKCHLSFSDRPVPASPLLVLL